MLYGNRRRWHPVPSVGYPSLTSPGSRRAALCSVHLGVSGARSGNTLGWKHGALSRRLFPEDLDVVYGTHRTPGLAAFLAPATPGNTPCRNKGSGSRPGLPAQAAPHTPHKC